MKKYRDSITINWSQKEVLLTNCICVSKCKSRCKLRYLCNNDVSFNHITKSEIMNNFQTLKSICERRIGAIQSSRYNERQVNRNN